MSSINIFKQKIIDSTLYASKRFNLSDKSEIPLIIEKIRKKCGLKETRDTICIYRFGTSKKGLDVEIGFPVSEKFIVEDVNIRELSEIKVISAIHKNNIKNIGESIQKIYKYASEKKYIVDEYYREIWKEHGEIEIQIPLHDWSNLFIKNLENEVEKSKSKIITPKLKTINPFSTIEDRFIWIKDATENLEKFSDKHCTYNVISKCAHVFPNELIKKARNQYLENQNIDDLIIFMKNESGWYGSNKRVKNKLFTWKNPANPEAFLKAKTKTDKINSYCFCPIVKHDPNNIPLSFCNCSAGWVRQIWEGIFQKEIIVNIEETIINNGEKCSFSFEIPV